MYQDKLQSFSQFSLWPHLAFSIITFYKAEKSKNKKQPQQK